MRQPTSPSLASHRQMTITEHVGKDNNMAVDIKILTLNVWGIPGVSKHREARMAAIADRLLSGPDEYDFVFLQEVWSKADFTFLANKVNKVLPYSQYFFSGVIGSGLCTLSRSPITEVHFHRFSLNGFAHKLHHGDWWGGKGVGLCRTSRHGLSFLLANTHLLASYQGVGLCGPRGHGTDDHIPTFHAEYNHRNDEYVHHRAVQAFETSELVRSVKKPGDLLIFGGDFNCSPTDFTYRLVKFYANMVDSYTDSPVKSPGSNGETNETPGNSYTSVKSLINNPTGLRIDYIFFQSSTTHRVKTKLCDQPWPKKVPQQEYSFSDHEPVRAILTASPRKDEDAEEPKPEMQAQTDALLDISAVCEQGMKKLSYNRRAYLALTSLLILLQLLYLVTLCLDISPALRISLGILSIAAMVFLMYFLFMGTIFYHLEFNGVKSTKCAVQCHLAMLTEKNAQIFEEERKRSLSFIK